MSVHANCPPSQDTAKLRTGRPTFQGSLSLSVAALLWFEVIIIGILIGRKINFRWDVSTLPSFTWNFKLWVWLLLFHGLNSQTASSVGLGGDWLIFFLSWCWLCFFHLGAGFGCSTTTTYLAWGDRFIRLKVTAVVPHDLFLLQHKKCNTTKTNDEFMREKIN